MGWLLLGGRFEVDVGSMQCNVEFENQHSLCSKIEETHGKP
jgi:hypothetical protein